MPRLSLSSNVVVEAALLTLFARCRASCKVDKIQELATSARAEGQNNIAFAALLLQGKVDECVELLVNTNRLPEAALFARTYCPSRVSGIVKLWKEDLGKVRADLIVRACFTRCSQAVADPRLARLNPRRPRTRRPTARPRAVWPTLRSMRTCSRLTRRISLASSIHVQTMRLSGRPASTRKCAQNELFLLTNACSPVASRRLLPR